MLIHKKKNKEDYLEEIKKAYDFMVQNNLDVLEYSDDEEKRYIKLVRKTAKAENIQILPVTSGQVPQNTQSKPNNNVQQPQQQISGLTINAPMSGIFYRSSSPSSPPYVREGDIVEPNTVICLIEAMKVFNEIKSEFKLKILKCIAENGKFVNEGDPLFLIEKL
jgi:acetyl-CoA carboxylase biotin carboxyl carrier protein